MKKKTPKNPKARNNSAHASLQSVRVYEESKKLLDIEKTINIAAGSIYEINVDQKLDVNAMKPLMQSLDDKNKALKSYIKGKPQSLQLKLLSQVSKNIHIVNNHFPRINKHITRVNEVIPIIKALLKLPEKESNYENDPILEKEQIKLSQYDAKLQFEQMNDVSDKLIGLLNDKLLLIIGVSEFLIAGVEDDGANDVAAEQRLPDELRVLFLASSVLYIIYRIKEIRDSIKTIFNSIKLCLQIMNSDRLESQYKALLKNGNNSVYNILSNTTPKVLQRTKKAIIEIVPGLDALDLKLKLDTLDLETVMKMTYGLIYEKANRIWENPYE